MSIKTGSLEHIYRPLLFIEKTRYLFVFIEPERVRESLFLCFKKINYLPVFHGNIRTSEKSLKMMNLE